LFVDAAMESGFKVLIRRFCSGNAVSGKGYFY
jgi:hypothetical protein